MFSWIRRIRKIFRIKLCAELVYVHDLEDVPTIHADVTVRLNSVEEVSRLNEVWKVDRLRMLERFKRGDDCYVGLVSNNFVSYHWVQYSGFHYIQQASKYIKIESGDAWIYHVRVSEEMRGRGINPFVYAKIIQRSKELGIKRLWIYTAHNNFANRSGLEKCNFKLAGKLFSVKVNSTYYLLISSLKFIEKSSDYPS